MSCRRVICYGGRGSLGSACVDHFKKVGYWVCSIDFKENQTADANVLVSDCDSSSGQEKVVLESLRTVLEDNKVDGIFCLAGGWAGGNASHKDFLTNSDLTWKQSVWSSCISASLASKYLENDGLLVFCGAQVALQPTPGMLGYGMAKAAVHHLTKSLAQGNSGLPAKVNVASIAPIMLNTPMNRKWLPKADQSTWTPLEFIAELFVNWLEGRNRPESGSIVQLVTKNGQTNCIST